MSGINLLISAQYPGDTHDSCAAFLALAQVEARWPKASRWSQMRKSFGTIRYARPASRLFISGTVALLSPHCGNSWHVGRTPSPHKNLYKSDPNPSRRDSRTDKEAGRVCGYVKLNGDGGNNRSEATGVDRHKSDTEECVENAGGVDL